MTLILWSSRSCKDRHKRLRMSHSGDGREKNVYRFAGRHRVFCVCVCVGRQVFAVYFICRLHVWGPVGAAVVLFCGRLSLSKFPRASRW